MKPATPVIDRLMAKVEKTETCWLWTGHIQATGYGKIGRGGRDAGMVYVHRVAYEHFVGPIPEGLQIDHLCRVRHCVNPEHLEVVTQAENILRGESPTAVNARKTRCPAGHEYTPENTYVQQSGARVCRTCAREWERQHPRRRRAA